MQATANGGISVAIRLTSDHLDRVTVENVVAVSLSKYDETKLLADLESLPRVESSGGDSIDVVLDAKPTSRHWKDWMVRLVQDLRASFGRSIPTALVDLDGG